jgi:hypothetical protein
MRVLAAFLVAIQEDDESGIYRGCITRLEGATAALDWVHSVSAPQKSRQAPPQGEPCLGTAAGLSDQSLADSVHCLLRLDSCRAYLDGRRSAVIPLRTTPCRRPR